MGERPIHIRQSDQNARSLKEELARIRPELEEMQKMMSERRNQFIEVQEQIQSISNEIYGSGEYIPAIVDETDLSVRKLEELHRQLRALQKEKFNNLLLLHISDRLKKVQDHLYALNSLCSVLGLDFKQTVSGVHPSLGNPEGSKSVNNDSIKQLAIAIQELREVKIQRMQKLQDLATTMLEIWNLMDTPIEEQQMFQNVTCNIAASELEVIEPNTLSEDFINCVEAEVSRLEELKSSKMKELVLKKRVELEEICRKTHLVPEIDSAVEYAVEAIESGSVDPAFVLEQIELQIAQVKEEAFCRTEILEKVEKWLSSCDEETWLEEYNRDENRYNAGRGTHLNLKRAEKACALVNKIPAMVDGLTSKTVAWEKDRGIEFTFNGIRLLSVLEDYTLLQQEKEQQRRRQRDMEKLKGQLIAEQEALYGSEPSPSRKSAGNATTREVSFGAAAMQTSKPDSKATQSCSTRKTDKGHQIEQLNFMDDGASSYLSAGLEMKTLFPSLINTACTLLLLFLDKTESNFPSNCTSFLSTDSKMMTLFASFMKITFMIGFVLLNAAAGYLLSYLRFWTTTYSGIVIQYLFLVKFAFFLSSVILTKAESYLLSWFNSFWRIDTNKYPTMLTLYTCLIKIPLLNISTGVLVVSCVVIILYLENLKPFHRTKQARFIPMSTTSENSLGLKQFEKNKESFNGKILPNTNPTSRTVDRVARQIIFSLDDEPRTSHLDGLNWEVLVVNEPIVNAYCLPGGKIIVYTGLLQHFESDAEIATIIAHEVGHVVARHSAERIANNEFFDTLDRKLCQFAKPEIVNTMSSLLLRLPLRRRMELEADYLALMLVASAGYDPQLVPSVFEKLGKLTKRKRDYLSSHPSVSERREALGEAQTMEQALAIFWKVRAEQLQGIF